MTVITSMRTRMISRIPTDTTKQSKRLKRDMKYDGRPIAYIFINISTANRNNSTLLVLSANKVKTIVKVNNLLENLDKIFFYC